MQCGALDLTRDLAQNYYDYWKICCIFCAKQSAYMARYPLSDSSINHHQ